jgi:hypothetical protein
MSRPPGRPPGTTKFDVYFTIRIDTETQEALAEIAREEDRPVASMARLILKAGIDACKEGKRPWLDRVVGGRRGRTYAKKRVPPSAK